MKVKLSRLMDEPLVWALSSARSQTLALVADLSPEAMFRQSVSGEHHPSWTLGHLLLADTYLLSLLKARPLADDFSMLLVRYGPDASPTASLTDYDEKQVLTNRLVDTGIARVTAIRAMSERDLAAPTPDPVLARGQPTIGHHIYSLVFHEGYHSGKLSMWRKTHGFSAVPWMFS